MSRFFTSPGNSEHDRASAPSNPLRAGAPAATAAGRSAKRFRGILSSLLLMVAAIFVQGCAKPYGAALRHYVEAPNCCDSLAELPVEPLRPGDKKSFDLGAGSPAYQFDTGKSYFRAFALPDGPYPYRVTARSYIIGDNLKSAYFFFPQLITLDKNRKPVRSTGPETFTLQRAGYFETMQETAGFPHKLEGGLTFTEKSKDERFLVVLTTGDLLLGKTTVTTAGDDPMLNTITVAEQGSAAKVAHSPTGRVSISLAPIVVAESASGMLEAPPVKTDKEPSSDYHPEVVTVRLASGKTIGAVELGRTTAETARRLFENAGAGLGPERRNTSTFTIGAAALTPKRFFTPPGSTYQLYFDDKGILVLFVDAAPVNLPLSGREFKRRFPEARESGRTLGSYEIQEPLTQCITLVAVFRTVGDTLESAAYGYGCQAK